MGGSESLADDWQQEAWEAEGGFASPFDVVVSFVTFETSDGFVGAT